MSLSGLIEGFPLEDVMGLVSTTAKTGVLRVTRGTDSAQGPGGEVSTVWFNQGLVVKFEVEGAADVADALFRVLRIRMGTFVFEREGPPSDGFRGVEVSPILDRWHHAATYVPPAVRDVRLVGTLNVPSVELNNYEWKLIVSVAEFGRSGDAKASRTSGDAGGVVGTVAERTGLSTAEAAAALGALAERGLVVLYPDLDLALQEVTGEKGNSHSGDAAVVPILAGVGPAVHRAGDGEARVRSAIRTLQMDAAPPPDASAPTGLRVPSYNESEAPTVVDVPRYRQDVIGNVPALTIVGEGPQEETNGVAASETTRLDPGDVLVTGIVPDKPVVSGGQEMIGVATEDQSTIDNPTDAHWQLANTLAGSPIVGPPPPPGPPVINPALLDLPNPGPAPGEVGGAREGEFPPDPGPPPASLGAAGESASVESGVQEGYDVLADPASPDLLKWFLSSVRE